MLRNIKSGAAAMQRPRDMDCFISESEIVYADDAALG